MTDLLLSARNLAKLYKPSRGRTAEPFPALAGVDLDVHRGSILAIAGRSGSGKSTLARLLAGLEEPSAGTIGFGGNGVATLAQLRDTVQLVFQETDWALNPRFSALEAIEEPLMLRTRLRRPERRRKASELMSSVGLAQGWADRRPTEFSAGQRKRIAIARSIAASPEALALDEPFAGLDLSAQAAMVNLLLSLRREQGLTLIFILHDIALAAALADEIAVLAAGTIADRCTSGDLFDPQRRPATRALVEASGLGGSAVAPPG